MTLPPVSTPPHLLGQDDAEHIFLNLYNSGRIPHAFLLIGPQGVGKCALAFRMARALLDNTPQLQDLNFDVNCRLSKQIADVSHPDLRFLYKGYTSDGSENISEQIKIDDIRSAIAFTMMTPSDSEHRILIIDDCHMIAKNGQNALLKTLEEPGKHTTIFLITHMPQFMLSTIKSRCVKMPMRLLKTEDIVQILQQKFSHIPNNEIQAYADIASGSMGDAMAYVEHDALSLYQTLMDALSQGADSVYTLCAMISTKKNAHMFDILCKLWQSFAHKIVISYAKNTQIPAVLQSEYDAYTKITQKYTGHKLLDFTNGVSQLLQQTKAPFYLDKKLVVLNALLPLHT